MKPTLGRIVLYSVTQLDAESLMPGHDGMNRPSPGALVPAVVVAVFGEGSHVNLRGLVDGDVSPPWWTSRSEGTEPGTWQWPPRKEEEDKTEADVEGDAASV